MQNRLDMQEEYTKYIRTLVKTREPDNKCERIINEEVNKKFQEILKSKSNKKYHWRND